MANLNKVMLMGNLTQDPELRHTPSGTAVTDLRLAVNRVWFDKQTSEKKEETVFIDVTLWDRTAENACQYLSKGRPVFVEGRLKMDEWNDKESGQKRSKISVTAENVQFLGGRSEGGGGGGGDGGGGGGGGGGWEKPAESAPAPQAAADNSAADPPDDEVPF